MLAFIFSFLFLVNPIVSDDTKIEWLSPLEHEFGDLKQGKPMTVDFRFRNTSDGPIVIENVRTSCGCTTPDWSDVVIAPNEESSIQIEYDAKKLGYFRKKITVFFSGQRKGEKLYISGYVE